MDTVVGRSLRLKQGLQLSVAESLLQRDRREEGKQKDLEGGGVGRRRGEKGGEKILELDLV